MEAFGRTIQLFLVEGNPSGLIIGTIHGWTGSVVVATQSTFANLLTRSETDRTGVYILFGPDPNDALLMRAYVGEADSVRDRIKQSAEERSFWETAVVITTSDEALTKGHVRYLEARLIELARAAGRVSMENQQSPSTEKRRLPEADKANMEAFLANLKIILPVVGLDLLKPNPARRSVPKPTKADAENKFEIRHKSGVRATAFEEEGEFIVLKDSEALKDAGYASNSSYGELKQELINKGVLLAGADGRPYRFAQPYAFKSPSAAAAVVLDRNANGRTEWKVVGKNMNYHDWQEEKATMAASIPQTDGGAIP